MRYVLKLGLMLLVYLVLLFMCARCSTPRLEWCDIVGREFHIAPVDGAPWPCGVPDLSNCTVVGNCSGYRLRLLCQQHTVTLSETTIIVDTATCHDEHEIVWK